MTFKENLLKKIRIDGLASTVLATMGPPDSGRRIDKEKARELVDMGNYRYEQLRDLDLYFLKEPEDGKAEILVLDNDLPVYHTTPEDVVLRKSPTVKEMVSIRNAIKILSDSDVLATKKEETVELLRNRLLGALNLDFGQTDVDDLAADTIRSLEMDYPEGIVEGLTLFGELLGYRKAPKVFQMTNFHIIGAVDKKGPGDLAFGPVVIYSLPHNKLLLIEEKIQSRDPEGVDRVHQTALGKTDPDAEGAAVVEFLKTGVVNRYLAGSDKGRLKTDLS